jgi:hypothetical protein
MKKTLLGIFAAGCMLLAFSTTSSAQKKVAVKLEGKAVPANRGANPNIKAGAPTTDTKASKSRSTCSLHFTNNTGYCVNVYVDGYFKGSMTAYGALDVYVDDGYTTYYCITCGQTLDWSGSGNCTSAYDVTLY